MKNKIIISSKDVFRNKKNILLIILISVIFFLGTIISVYEKSVEKHIDENIFTDYLSRMFSVGKKDTTYEEKQNELEKIEHISAIFPNYEIGVLTLKNKDWENKKLDGTIWAYIANSETLPNITYGSDFKDNNNYYMVCPEYLYPSLELGENKKNISLNNKDMINVKELIGQTITFNQEAFDSDGNIDYNKEIAIQVVGIYKSKNTEIDENICYINEKVRKDSYYQEYEDLPNPEENGFIKTPSSAIIVIDDYNNYNSILEELTKNEFIIEPYEVVDEEFVTDIQKANHWYSLVIMIVCSIILGIFITKKSLNSIRIYQLYNYLGYAKKDISMLNYISNIMTICTSFFITLFFSLLYKYILKGIIKVRPFFFEKREVVISMQYLYLYFIISFVLTIVITYINNRKIYKRLVK